MGILDNAKKVAIAVREIKNIELYARVLDLNAGIMDLVEEDRKLHGENEDLKKTLQLRVYTDCEGQGLALWDGVTRNTLGTSRAVGR